MRIFKRIISFSIEKPKVVLALTVVIFLIFLSQFPKIKIDTDPEDMLSKDEFARVYHHEVKKEFGLYDFIVVGIVNEKDEQGVFNPDTLGKILKLTKKIESIKGVINYELISLSTKDNVKSGGRGMVMFEWLMRNAPENRRQAALIRDEAKDNPMLDGTIVSENGKVACIYIPIEKKEYSYRISKEVEEYAKGLKGDERYYITGLPVAEDTFGVQMFRQMAVSAPLAGLVIFLIMLFFFKKIPLIVSPMLVAITSIVCAMGFLIGKGFSVHIMSSMIPIFLMPIAVVDSVHILSDFYDSYPNIRDKKKTILHVMDKLFTPMLYTSLTSAAGFASLAFTPIPPVRIFGIFVALGIGVAWILTITFIPAYLILVNEKTLVGLGSGASADEANALDKVIEKIGKLSDFNWKYVLLGLVLVIGVSFYGISKISINDNPVKWFVKSHKIRVADKVLNENFGGTYTAYLVLDGSDSTEEEPFKDPKNLVWIEGLQKQILNSGYIGKSTSVADVVKKVYYELLGGDRKNNVIPGSRQAVAQCLLSFENSHKPDDLWHLVTEEYDKANIWVQLKSGDNQNMEKVISNVNDYIKKNPPPIKIKANWAGLTYINTVWQDKMVKGMMRSLLGSFLIVFIMMIILFRSFIWGLLCMIPLSVTILFIYGIIGIIGKDYDMPVAVLSSLTLGLSVDFAIHFLQRARDIYSKSGSWHETREKLFGEPARAITRNAIVIALGFIPLFAASLVPYRTVGTFLISIMVVSCFTTLFALTALLSGIRRFVFK